MNRTIDLDPVKHPEDINRVRAGSFLEDTISASHGKLASGPILYAPCAKNILV
jgi:hypothetical protein